MNTAFRILAACAIAHLPLHAAAAPREPAVFLREDFNDLTRWKPLYLPGVERHSRYTITESGPGRYLTASSRGSASGIELEIQFDPYTHPVVRWRWKVDTVYPDADPNTKKGDDYPMSVFVIFHDAPNTGPASPRTAHGLAMRLFGVDPRLTSLSYVWANQRTWKPIYENPYTSRCRVIPLRGGAEQLGQWVEERVDVLADYRRAFGKNPPAFASLAIMNDSDNTGSTGVSHMDFIEVRENGAADKNALSASSIFDMCRP